MDKLFNARAILEDYTEVGSNIWERSKRAGKNRSGISINSWQCTNLLERNGSLKDWRVKSSSSGNYRRKTCSQLMILLVKLGVLDLSDPTNRVY